MPVSVKEITTLISLLTFRRFFNYMGVWWSYFISLITKVPFVISSPFAISTETNTNCNLSCPECPTGNSSLTRSTGKIDSTQFKSIIDSVYKKTFYLNLFLQGEPFLHTELAAMAEYAVKKKMFVCVSTNGHFLDKENCKKIIESGLQKIIISLDGTTQETYEKYRKGGNIKSVTQGIENLIETKKEWNSKFPMVVVQMLVNKFNEHEIFDMERLCKKIGVDQLELKSMQLEKHPDFLPENKIITRYYKSPDGTLKPINKFKNHCKRLWTTAVITWDGQMAACCYDKNAEYGPGNVFTSPILTLWKTKEMNAFRKRVLNQRREIEICRNCNE
jgi:radical SAM protein with 4Fe4S-binding SPASM domain